MATKRDYYEVLGVDKNASPDEIKKAYRNLAKKYHPDVSTEPNATEIFAEIQVAYDCLSDPQKRSNYDQYGTEDPTNGFNTGGGGFSGFSGFEDIFSSFFGGGNRSRNSRTGASRGRDIVIDMTLTFEEACFGARKTITVNRYEECRHCHGTGADSKDDIVTCNRCHGQGTVIVEQATILGRIRTEGVCPDCGGRGKKIKKTCSECNGNGKIKQKRSIEVEIPSGIDSDQTYSLRGEGDTGTNGGGKGDLLIRINVKPHEIFVRNGNDILLELPITFSQAALGASIEISTIYGTSSLKIPAGTQSGTKFKMTGKGINNKFTGRTGSQVVTIKVITPTNLSSKQKELFQELSKTDETTNNSFFDKIKKFFKGKN